jgi:hypothetical protein
VLATIVLVALPAHAFVIGFGANRPPARAPSTSRCWLASRSWLAGGVLTALSVAAVRGSA